jgi:hypothetical protein
MSLQAAPFVNGKMGSPPTDTETETDALRVSVPSTTRELRLSDLWHAVWRTLVLGACVLCRVDCGDSFIAPRYRAQTILAAVTQDGNGGSLAALAGRLGASRLAGVGTGSQNRRPNRSLR